MAFFQGQMIDKEPNTKPVRSDIVLFLYRLNIQAITCAKLITPTIDPNKNSPKCISPEVWLGSFKKEKSPDKDILILVDRVLIESTIRSL